MYSPNQCEPRPKLFLRLDIICDIIHVSYIVIGLHEEPDNFYGEKRSVALVTGNLFFFWWFYLSSVW